MDSLFDLKRAFCLIKIGAVFGCSSGYKRIKAVLACTIRCFKEESPGQFGKSHRLLEVEPGAFGFLPSLKESFSWIFRWNTLLVNAKME